MNSRSSELSRKFTHYQNVSWSTNQVDDFSYLTVECGAGKRQHRRVIGKYACIRGWQGHPLLYLDTYDSGDEPEVFAYVRHRFTPTEFLRQLNRFMGRIEKDYAELGDRGFPYLIAVNGQPTVGELKISHNIHLQGICDASFFRLDLPFGAISIEFSDKNRIFSDELSCVLNSGQLPREVESPLVGFDFSAGDIYKPLLMACHWAAGTVPEAVLEGIVGEAEAMVHP